MRFFIAVAELVIVGSQHIPIQKQAYSSMAHPVNDDLLSLLCVEME